MRVCAVLLAVALSTAARGATPAIPVEEARVPAGQFYVGKAMGERNFKALVNASTPGFLVMRDELSQGLFATISAWGTLHGYTFEAACTVCERDKADRPVAGVGWRDAALLANALSEADGLDPVYRDKAGQPIRSAIPPAVMDHAIVEPTLSGFRLPTIPEWQIALRGADKALADGTYGAHAAGRNALGLRDTAGPLSEWTASTMDLGGGPPYHLYCNAEVDGVRTFSNCDIHTASGAGTSIGFRFVRKAAGP